MLVQLQPVQISLLWDNIRETAISVNRIPPEHRASYEVMLLKNLMLGKYQCWLCYDLVENERRIHAIGVSAIVEDLAYGRRGLDVVSLYGYRTLSDELSRSAIDTLREYAKNTGCAFIQASTNVQRIKDLCELTGFVKVHETFQREVS